MIAYGIVILSLIRYIHYRHPQVTQSCCGDNTGARGHFADLRAHLEDLMVCGPPRV